MKSIIVVDDHEMVRIGIKHWLETKSEWKVVGEAASIAQCLECLSMEIPAILLVDVDLGKESGFDLITAVKEKYPSIAVVMYSMHEESNYILKAKQAGAKGYISKGSNLTEFIKGIECVYSGNEYLEQNLESAQLKIMEAVALLSKRECMIFMEILNGKNNDEIAAQFNLKKHTVEVYTTNIFDKTFCSNRNELIVKFTK